MSSAEFAEFRLGVIKTYAADRVPAGDWDPRVAEELATTETDDLLPDGVDTRGMLLFIAEGQDHTAVGSVWVALEHPRLNGAWIYFIEIAADYRNHGYGRALLASVEAEVGRRGIPSIGLSVFSFNQDARRLYESSGYETATVQMRKALVAAEAEPAGLDE